MNRGTDRMETPGWDFHVTHCPGEGSELLLAGQNIPPQSPVAHQAEAGIAKCRGLVVFKEKVADPGKRVTLNQGRPGEPPFLGCDGGDQQCECDAGPCEVQAARSAVRMLTQVERVEIAKGAKS